MRPTGLSCLLCWLIASAFGIAACGFHPLHGRADRLAGAPGDSAAAVRVAAIPDRVGQMLHTMLSDRLTPPETPRGPGYLLEVALEEEIEELAIREDETATRANLTLQADFRLRNLESGEVVLDGMSISTNSYNILASQFATDVAEEDARGRAVRALAEDIATRVAVFSTRPRHAGPV